MNQSSTGNRKKRQFINDRKEIIPKLNLKHEASK